MGMPSLNALMTDIHQLITNRRSIRRYTPQPIDPDQVRLILEAALMAPTSKNSRPWQFIAVEDPEVLEKLSHCKSAGAMPIAKAPLAIVVAADPEVSEAWIEDASIAASYIQLQAADLNLGSCWIEVRDRYGADGVPASDYIQELLKMPRNLPVLCVITIGHPDEVRKPQATDKLLWEKVHIGEWQPQQHD